MKRVPNGEDLDRRVAEHNDPTNPKSKYTAKHGPWSLVWSERHPTRSEAMERERQIKRMKSAMWIRETLLTQLPERVPMLHRD